MKRRITADDLWAIPRVGAPVPSPDGSRLIVPVTTYSMETNEATTRLWVVSASGGEPRPLTTADSTSGQPAVSPDGRRVAFVRKPGPKSRFPDQPQIYVMPIDGGEPERLTDLPLGAADPRWFPDGRRLAFVAPILIDAPTPEGTEKLAKEREAEPVKARVSEDRVYRAWDRWLTDGRVHHIFTIDLASRQAVDLTPDSRRWFDYMDPSNQYRISPDGREIAFCACRTEPPHDPIRWGVFTLQVSSRRAVRLDEFPEAVHPVYSPDGRWIVYGMQRDPEFYADRVRLVAYDRRKRTHTVLTEGWDRSASGWSFDGRSIVFAAEDEGRVGIFELDVRRPGRPRRLARGGTFSSPRPAGGRIYGTLDTLSRPPEVVSIPRRGGPVRTLTSFTRPILKRLELGAVEEIFFRGAEGRRVQMFFIHPPGKRARRSPLVHLVHGGPHGMFGDNWHWRWNAHLFGSPGTAAALVNFHGSTSWGQEFARCILGRWGDRPYADVMAATDELIRRGLVDPRRMAAAGGSYGGYLVSWIASQTDRFRCLINHAGVCDLQTQWASDFTQSRERSMGGSPWRNIEGMDRWNPLRHAKNFKTPMLVIHGERDYRVPYDEALQIYNVYKGMKLPARLVCYPDENHWILKPRNSRHWYGEVLAWLARWLKVPKPARPR
jgi:dipeptidyl aminopeptidase/acylaminoacyl peptidase